MAWPMGKESTISIKKNRGQKCAFFERGEGENWLWLHIIEHKEHESGSQGEIMARGEGGLSLKQGE